MSSTGLERDQETGEVTGAVPGMDTETGEVLLGGGAGGPQNEPEGGPGEDLIRAGHEEAGGEGEPPAAGEDEPQVPAGGEGEPQALAGGGDEPRVPEGGEDEPQAPAGGEDEPQAPAGGEDEPQAPAGGEDEPRVPAGGGDGPWAVAGDDENLSKDEGERAARPTLAEGKALLRRCCLPAMYCKEVWEVIKLGTPMFLIELIVILIGLISTAYSGRVGDAELSGAAMAIAVFNIAVLSIGIGLAQTFDTLISQTYGGGNMKRIGVILQRATLFSFLACFISWGLLANTEPLVLKLSNSSEIARIAQMYNLWLASSVPAAFVYQLEVRYLQNQGIIWPQVLTGMIVLAVNWAFNACVERMKWDLGYHASAAAAAASHYLLAGILFVFIYARGYYKETWPGLSLDCLQEWGPFFKEAFASLIMLGPGFWVFEIWVFVASVISRLELEAQSIIYNVYMCFFTLPLGIAGAASVRVGNALGANEVQNAKLSRWASLMFAVAVGLVLAVLLYVMRGIFGVPFTGNEEVRNRVSEAMVPFAVMYFIDSLAGVTGGAVRGVGLLVKGACCSVGSHCVGLACGCFIAGVGDKRVPVDFKTGGIVGLAIGVAVGVLLQLLSLSYVMWSCDWQLAAKDAQVTAGLLIPEMEVRNQGPTAAAAPNDSQDRAQGKIVMGTVLTNSQLFKRRGLALLSMVAFLGLAILVRYLSLKAITS